MSNEKHTERDYSLLRPFDLEAAKRGEAICFSSGSEITQFIVGPDSVGDFVFVVPGGQFYFAREKSIRMAPICWVEGRPVYRGDVLWCRLGNRHVIVKVYGEQVWFESETWLDRKELTWTPPKVKREGWVNIYPKDWGGIACVGYLVNETREDADVQADDNRIACVRIEWEEVAK